jgi:hypothetical protein
MKWNDDEQILQQRGNSNVRLLRRLQDNPVAIVAGGNGLMR